MSFATAEQTTSQNFELLPVSYTNPNQQLQAYYRAKTFSANSGINPLVAAAAPLFALLPRIESFHTYQDIPGLQKHLMHEVNAFASSAARCNYPQTLCWLAQYLLCELIDESLNNTTWGADGVWQQYALVTHHLHQQPDLDKFFSIVTRLLHEPQPHIDLLEFAYLCLSLGYQGKYLALAAQGQEQLALLSNQMYQVIRHIRGDFPKKLSQVTMTETIQRRWFPCPSVKTSLGLMAVTVGLLYGSFAALVNMSSKSVLNQFQQLKIQVNHIDGDL
jgi:type VI secretion system protein ImpK